MIHDLAGAFLFGVTFLFTMEFVVGQPLHDDATYDGMESICRADKADEKQP